MKDPDLALCSSGARGAWVDVLCLMFECRPRGYLIKTNGTAWTLEQLAVAVRGDWQENLVYLKELVHNGVMKQAPKGHKFRGKERAFYNARMVRDEGQREAWKFQKQRQRTENKESLSTPLSTRSSSSSSSSSSNPTSNPTFSQDSSISVKQKEGKKNGWVDAETDRKESAKRAFARVFPES